MQIVKNRGYKTDAKQDISVSLKIILWKVSVSGRLKPIICLQSVNVCIIVQTEET
jgi:hypothetical protein